MGRKVVVNRRSPLNLRREDYLGTCGYLSLSISNVFHYSNDVLLHIEWMEKHFSKYKIVVGDYLNRHNSLIEMVDFDDFLSSSFIKGREIANNYGRFLSPHSKGKIIHWSDLMQNDHFEKQFDLIQKEFENNLHFHDCIHQTGKDYMARKKGRGEKFNQNEDVVLKCSSDYILEELAVMSVLFLQGYKTQVYFGTSIDVLKQMINGRISSSLLISNSNCIDLSNK